MCGDRGGWSGQSTNEMGANEEGHKTAAEQTIGETKYRKNEEWFDEECAAYIREKNNARQKCSKRKRDPTMRNTENGEGRLIDYVRGKRGRA